MWDWISDAVSGLGSLFSSGAADVATDAVPLLAEPSYTFTGSGYTDLLGNAVSGPTNYNASTYFLGDGGTPYSFIDPTSGDLVSGATRGGVYDITTGQQLGFNNGSGNLVDLNGNPVRGTTFGGFNSSGFGDALRGSLDMPRLRAGSGNGGGGAGTSPIGISNLQSGSATSVPPAQTGTLMIPSSPVPAFNPIKMESPAAAASAPDLRGLAGLFAPGRR